MSDMHKVVRDGKVAVLYSPGFGAGWYTWNRHCPWLVFHPELVEAVEAGDTDKAELIAERLAGELGAPEDPYVYTDGAYNLEISWLEEGTRFEIEEYDGSESIHLIGGREYLSA